MPYYVYILLCEGGSYYTGYAKNVKKRFTQHKNGRGARYTKLNKPEKIVYKEEFATCSEAMRREKEIKSFSHRKKQRLIKVHKASERTEE